MLLLLPLAAAMPAQAQTATGTIAPGAIVATTGFPGPIHVDSTAVSPLPGEDKHLAAFEFKVTNLSGHPGGRPDLDLTSLAGIDVFDHDVYASDTPIRITNMDSGTTAVDLVFTVSFDGCSDTVTGLSIPAPDLTIGGTTVTLSWLAGTTTNADGTLQLISCDDAYDVTVASDAGSPNDDSDYATDGSGFDTEVVGDEAGKARIGTVSIGAFNSQDSQGNPVSRYYTTLLYASVGIDQEACSAANVCLDADSNFYTASLTVEATRTGTEALSAEFGGGLQFGDDITVVGATSPIDLAVTDPVTVSVFTPSSSLSIYAVLDDTNRRRRPGVDFAVSSLTLTSTGGVSITYNYPTGTTDQNYTPLDGFRAVSPPTSIDFGEATTITNGLTEAIYVDSNAVNSAQQAVFEFQINGLPSGFIGLPAFNFGAGNSVSTVIFYDSNGQTVTENNQLNTTTDTFIGVTIFVNFAGCGDSDSNPETTVVTGLSLPVPSFTINNIPVALTGWQENLITCGEAYSVSSDEATSDSEYATDGSGFDTGIAGDEAGKAKIGTVRISFNNTASRYYTSLWGGGFNYIDASAAVTSLSLNVINTGPGAFDGGSLQIDAGESIALNTVPATEVKSVDVAVATGTDLPIYLSLADGTFGAGSKRPRPGLGFKVTGLELAPTEGTPITYALDVDLDGFASVSGPTASIAFGDIGVRMNFAGPIHVDKNTVIPLPDSADRIAAFEFKVTSISDTSLVGTLALDFAAGAPIFGTNFFEVDSVNNETISSITAGTTELDVLVTVSFAGCSDTVTGLSLPAPVLAVNETGASTTVQTVQLSWPDGTTNADGTLQLITCGDPYSVSVSTDVDHANIGAGDSEYATDGSGFDTEVVGDEAGKARIGNLDVAFNSQGGTVSRYYTSLMGIALVANEACSTASAHKSTCLDASTFSPSALDLTVQASRTGSVPGIFNGTLQLGDSGTGVAINLGPTDISLTANVSAVPSSLPIYAVLNDAGTVRDRPGVAFAVTELGLTPTIGAPITHSYPTETSAPNYLGLDGFAALSPAPEADIALGDITTVSGFTEEVHMDRHAVAGEQTATFEFLISNFSGSSSFGTLALSFGTVTNGSIDEAVGIKYYNSAGGEITGGVSTSIGTIGVAVPVIFNGCDNAPGVYLSLNAPSLMIGGTPVTLTERRWGNLISCDDAYNVTLGADANNSKYATNGAGFDTTVGDEAGKALIGNLYVAFNDQGASVSRYYTSLADGPLATGQACSTTCLDADTAWSSTSLTLQATRTGGMETSTESFDGKLQLGDDSEVSGATSPIDLAVTDPVTVSVSSGTRLPFSFPIYATLDDSNARSRPGVDFAVTRFSLTLEGGTAIAYSYVADLDEFVEQLPSTADIVLGDIAGVSGFTEAIYVARTKLTSTLDETSRTGIFEFVISGFSNTSLSGTPALSFGTVTDGSINDTAITFYDAGGTETTNVSTADTVRVSVPVSFNGCSDTVTGLSLPAPTLTIGSTPVVLTGWPSGSLITCTDAYSVRSDVDDTGDSEYAANADGFNPPVGTDASKTQIGTISIAPHPQLDGVTNSRYYTSLSDGPLTDNQCSTTCFDVGTRWSATLKVQVSRPDDSEEEAFDGQLQLGNSGTGVDINLDATNVVTVSGTVGALLLPIYAVLNDAGTARARPGVKFVVTELSVTPTGAAPITYSYPTVDTNPAYTPLDGFALAFDPAGPTADIALGDLNGFAGFTGPIHVDSTAVNSAQASAFEFRLTNISGHSDGALALNFTGVTGGTSSASFYAQGTGTDGYVADIAAGTNAVDVVVSVSFAGCGDSDGDPGTPIVTGLSVPVPSLRIGGAPVALTGWPSGNLITCGEAYNVTNVTVASDTSVPGDAGDSKYATNGTGFDTDTTVGDEAGKAQIGTVIIGSFNSYGGTISRYYTSLPRGVDSGYIDATSPVSLTISATSDGSAAFNGGLQIGDGTSSDLDINGIGSIPVEVAAATGTDLPIYLSLAADTFGAGNERDRPEMSFNVTGFKLTPTGDDPITYARDVDLDSFAAQPFVSTGTTADIALGDVGNANDAGAVSGFTEAIHVDRNAVNLSQPTNARTGTFEFVISGFSNTGLTGAPALHFAPGSSVNTVSFYDIDGLLADANNQLNTGTDTSIGLAVTVVFNGCSADVTDLSIPAPTSFEIGSTPVVLTGWPSGNLITCADAYSVSTDEATSDSKYAASASGFIEADGDQLGRAKIGEISFNSQDDQGNTVSRYYTSVARGSLATGETCSITCLEAGMAWSSVELTVEASRPDSSTDSFDGKLQLGETGTGVAIGLAATPVPVSASVSGTITSPIPIYATLDDTNVRARPGVAFAVTGLVLTPTGGAPITYSYPTVDTDPAYTPLDGFARAFDPDGPRATIALGDVGNAGAAGGVNGFTDSIHVDRNAVNSAQTATFEFEISGFSNTGTGGLSGAPALSFGTDSTPVFYDADGNVATSISSADTVRFSVEVSFAGCSDTVTGLRIPAPSLTIGNSTTVQLSWPGAGPNLQLISCGDAYNVTVSTDVDHAAIGAGDSEYATGGTGFDATVVGDLANKALIGTVGIGSFNDQGAASLRYYTSLAGGPLATGQACSTTCLDGNTVWSSASLTVSATRTGTVALTAGFDGGLQIDYRPSGGTVEGTVEGAAMPVSLVATGGVDVTADFPRSGDIIAGSDSSSKVWSIYAVLDDTGTARLRPGVKFAVTGLNLTPTGGTAITYSYPTVDTDPAYTPLDDFAPALDTAGPATASIDFGGVGTAGDAADVNGFTGPIYVDRTAVNSAQTGTFEFQISGLPNGLSGVAALSFAAGSSANTPVFYDIDGQLVDENNQLDTGTDTSIGVAVPVSFAGCDTAASLSIPAPTSFEIGSTSVTLTGWPSGNFITCGEAYTVSSDEDEGGTGMGDSEYATDGTGFNLPVTIQGVPPRDDYGMTKIGTISFNSQIQGVTVSRYYTRLGDSRVYFEATTDLYFADLTVEVSRTGTEARAESFDGKLQLGDSGTGVAIGLAATPVTVTASVSGAMISPIPIYAVLDDITSRDRPGVAFVVTGFSLTRTLGATVAYSDASVPLDDFAPVSPGPTADIALGDLTGFNGFAGPIHVDSTEVNSALDEASRTGRFEFQITNISNHSAGALALNFTGVTGGTSSASFYVQGTGTDGSVTDIGADTNAVDVLVTVLFAGCGGANAVTGLSVPAPSLTIGGAPVTLTGWPSDNFITCGVPYIVSSDEDEGGTGMGNSEYADDAAGFNLPVGGDRSKTQIGMISFNSQDGQGNPVSRYYRTLAETGAVCTATDGVLPCIDSATTLSSASLTVLASRPDDSLEVFDGELHLGDSGTGTAVVAIDLDAADPSITVSVDTETSFPLPIYAKLNDTMTARLSRPGVVFAVTELSVTPAGVAAIAYDPASAALDGFDTFNSDNIVITLPTGEISGGIIAGINIDVSAATADQPALYIATDVLATDVLATDMAQDFYNSFITTADLATGDYTLRVDLAGGSFIGNAAAENNGRFADGSVYAAVKPVGADTAIGASEYVSNVASSVDISFTTDAAGAAEFELLLPIQFAGCVSAASELRATVSFVAVPDGSVTPDAIEQQFIGCARAYTLSGNSGSDTGWGGGDSQYVENGSGSGFGVGVFGPVLSNFRLPADTADKAAIGVVELSFNPDNIATDAFYLDIGDVKTILSGAAGEVVVKVTASDPAGLAGVSFDDTPGDVADFTDGVAELPVTLNNNNMLLDAIYLSLAPMSVRPAAMFSGEIVLVATNTAIDAGFALDSFAEDNFAICGEFDWIGDSSRMVRNYIRMSGLAGFDSVEVTLWETAVNTEVTGWQTLNPTEFGFSPGDDVIVIRTWELERMFGAFLRGDVRFRINGVPAAKVDCDRLIRSSPSYAVSGFGNNGGDNLALDGDD